MTVSEHYERGLTKLGLYHNHNDCPDSHRDEWRYCNASHVATDLRTDTTFAFRVLEAMKGMCGWSVLKECWLVDLPRSQKYFPSGRGEGPTLADALYAAVEALGGEE